MTSAETVAGEVMRSKKYAALDEAAIMRVCGEAVVKYPKTKDAVKAAKKELHIIYGAFVDEGRLERAESMIMNYGGDACGMMRDKAFAARLMELHSSTAERAGREEEIYSFIGRYFNQRTFATDIGCGFNPFALPFLPVQPAGYAAYDICARTIRTVNLYFSRLNNPSFFALAADAAAEGVFGGAEKGGGANSEQGVLDGAEQSVSNGAEREFFDDVEQGFLAGGAAAAPGTTAVLLMFKLFPLLERQRKGLGFALLKKLAYSFAIVSFPTKSASGREKGMEGHYSGLFENGLPERCIIIDKATFGNEMFYVINK